MKACSSTESTLDASVTSKKDDDKDSGICSLYCLASCLAHTSIPSSELLDNAEISNLLLGTSTVQPFLRKSIFSNVPCTINFYTKGQKVKKPSSDYASQLTWCHNSLLPLVMRQSLAASHFKIVDECKSWLGYWGRHLKSAQYRRIKSHQKLMTDSDDGKYSIMPYTYILPKDGKRLKAYLAFPTVRHVIVKPPASARGSGINIVSRYKHIPPKTPLVAQHYIEKPFLIHGSKFDLRLYIYVTSLEPLRVYMYENGLVRFASVPYSSSLSSYTNQYMHLTNYSINRLSQENGMADEPVQKWTLIEFWDYITREGYDAAALKRDIQSVAVKAIIACEYHIRQHQVNYSEFPFVSHELFGMDILVDSTLRPWLLEMNISPSLQSSTPVDIGVKAPLACDVLNMCGITFPPLCEDFENSLAFRVKPHSGQKSKEHLRKEAAHVEHFIKCGVIRDDILSQLTDMDLRYLTDFEDEFSRRGKFELIYPVPVHTEHYLSDMRSPVYANLLLNEWQKFQAVDRQHGLEILEKMCINGTHIAKLPVVEADDDNTDDNSTKASDIVNLADEKEELLISNSESGSYDELAVI